MHLKLKTSGYSYENFTNSKIMFIIIINGMLHDKALYLREPLYITIGILWLKI